MGLIVKHSDGSGFLNIENKTYDDVSTSLRLPGKGVLNWGEAYINNFVRLLENFASSYEPQGPQVGQIWYNTGTGELLVYTTSKKWEVINKDNNIEAKFDDLINKLNKSSAGVIAPVSAEQGQTWFDTSVNVLKVFDGTHWVSFGFNSTAAYVPPASPKPSDLWFDKNVSNLKVYDGEEYQRIVSTIESVTQPVDASVGQWWTNPSTGQMFAYTNDPSTGNYFWKEIGATAITEGVVLPIDAKVGALHISRTADAKILYVNKGTKTNPVWVEIPEFGGALVSANAPSRVIDGMLWLDGNDNLKVRKSGAWVDIDETAITYISDTMPENAKEGLVWFDTAKGVMQIKVGTTWRNVQAIGLIEYGVAPAAPAKGQLWYDNINGELKIWTSSTWAKVNSSATIVSYMTPSGAKDGQLWLDTIASEMKVKINGRWASLPENARAYTSLPANPKQGDMAYVNNALKIFDGINWKDININIDNSTSGSNVSVSYDELSHEIVLSSNGVVTRVPLAIKRDVIVENVGITSDVVEVIHPQISEGERRIINIQKINLDRKFFVFKNGQFTDNWRVDAKDLILNSARGDDEIDVLQFNGDISINYLVKKFKAQSNGNFTINNYTRTIDEQESYDVVKNEYDTKLKELLKLRTNGDQEATFADLLPTDLDMLKAIESRFPIKTSNEIADLSLGGVMVFKEGIFIPSSNLTLNNANDNTIVIPNVSTGEIFTIVQLVAGTDYKAAFFSKEYAFKIGEVVSDPSAGKNVKGKVMSDLLKAAPKNIDDQFGKVNVHYTYNTGTKKVTFDLVNIDTNYQFIITRNNLFISPINYTIDKVNNTLTMYANDQDEIRFFQFYLPHNYVPVEFNYKHGLAKADGWITMELNRDFDLASPLMVFRNGLLQQNENIKIITQETAFDSNGAPYIVNGLRKVQIFGDVITNKESISGIKIGDVVTIMQVSQPTIYNIFLEEFYAISNGFNSFAFKKINKDKKFIVFRNGLKLDDINDEFYVNASGKLVVANCNGPSIKELSQNPNSKGDTVCVYQFQTKDVVANDDLVATTEVLTATKTGAEYYQLINTQFIKDEFLLVFKNGQLVTRKQPEDATTTQTQINTFRVFAERVYHNTTPAYDPTGRPIIDSNGNQVMNVDTKDFTDITAFSLDNVVKDEKIYIYEFNKKVTNVNGLTSASHYEILPKNNIQRIYTSKFHQLSTLTLIFQDGLIIDRKLDSVGNDTIRVDGALRILDQYAVDNSTASILVNDWKVGGKLRIHQLTAAEKDIKTITLTVVVANNGTFDVFLPGNETYVVNTGALEIYVDKVVQWSGEDYFEVANNRVMFAKQLMKGQTVKIIVRN